MVSNAMLVVLINFLMPSMKKMFWLFELFQEVKRLVCILKMS